ncbi:MAG TPA: LD-carboxypeptidase [Syntrophorhabdales bacterium]|nr:LD-carboxypeptidase [Syntrophorhabdales bacterium]
MIESKRTAMLIKPPTLKRGATVCLVAPASAVIDVASLERGKRLLEERGYRVVEGAHVRDTMLLFAGEDENRADDLNRAFADPAIDAIFCVKGGAGTARMLPYVDFGLISRNPKIFVGYSDITILQIAMLKRCGLVTFYGPMVATEFGQSFTPFTEAAFFRMLTTPQESIQARNRPGRKMLTLCPGEASGQLVGGCLSIFVSTLGTEWEADTQDKILFFEDIDERPHRIDRYLTQLLLANKLQAASAVVFGSFTRCEYTTRGDHVEPRVRVLDILKDRFLPLQKPCLYGLQFGHVRDKLTVPNGGYAFLDATHQRLLVEPAVRP